MSGKLERFARDLAARPIARTPSPWRRGWRPAGASGGLRRTAGARSQAGGCDVTWTLACYDLLELHAADDVEAIARAVAALTVERAVAVGGPRPWPGETRIAGAGAVATGEGS